MARCDICKYYEEDFGCTFSEMGSGNPQDAPCFGDRDSEEMDIMIDLTENEAKALEILTKWAVEDDADARHALHDALEELAKIKGIEIPNLEED